MFSGCPSVCAYAPCVRANAFSDRLAADFYYSLHLTFVTASKQCLGPICVTAVIKCNRKPTFSTCIQRKDTDKNDRYRQKTAELTSLKSITRRTRHKLSTRSLSDSQGLSPDPHFHLPARLNQRH